MEVKKIKRYSVELVKNHPDHVFIFGDNLCGIGCGGQAQIRYCQNAHGIPTKSKPSQLSNSFFTDKNYESNIAHINKALDSIPKYYKVIVFPEDGLGTGLAELPTRAPKTYAYLNKAINERYGDVYDC